MQVERQHRGACSPGGEWRTGEEYIGICPVVGDNLGKTGLIPHTTFGRKQGIERPCAIGFAEVGLARWRGTGATMRQSVVGSGECSCIWEDRRSTEDTNTTVIGT